MARCEHCPLGIAIDALNDYVDDFEDGAVIDPNSQGNNLQVRARTYKKLFERVVCSIDCQYSPYAKESEVSFSVGGTDSDEEGFVTPNADSIVLDLIASAENTPETDDETSEADDCESETTDEPDEPDLTSISMGQFLADLQNRDINPRTIQACVEPFQTAIQLAVAAQSQFGPRYVDPAGYLQSEQSRKAGKNVQKKVNFGFHTKS